MRLTPGTHISFSYKGNRLIGMLLQEEGGASIIKLDSGYNLTVKRGDLKEITELKVVAKRKGSQPKRIVQEGLPPITILHTGGTVASKVDYSTGAVVAKYTAEELLDLYPALSAEANISSELIRNMMSDDMRFDHYNIIGEAVQKAIKKGAVGVIITHGTDTMHYTAAALGFMLKNLSVPVVLVGSQRSSDRGSSDAVSNLLAACRFITAAKGRAGVFTCMHATPDDNRFFVIDAFHVRKMHTSRRDAFKPINKGPYAVVEGTTVIFKEKATPLSTQKPALLPFDPKVRVGFLYVHPNMSVKEVESCKELDALVVLGTGLGHIPITAIDEFTKEHPKIYDAIKALAKRIPVVVAAQTINGRINMDVYTPGRKLQEAGVLGQGLDITPETAFIKLAWLLSTYEKKDVRKLYGENLRGEFSERSENETFE